MYCVVVMSRPNAIYNENLQIPVVNRPMTRKLAAQMASKQKQSEEQKDFPIIDVDDYKPKETFPEPMLVSDAMLEEVLMDEEVEIEEADEDLIVDIDIGDKKNPLAVVEYVNDLYAYYKKAEVEILSCIRHPNMVLLLGACPEYGCLVYEYMSNGSLEDRLLLKGNSKPLSWQHRFRIAAEIGAGLLFLHQTKPEPLVHRDLKPANILLDRNFVSKISDVGLARIVLLSVADAVTQYHMTSTAGTFCYIDPEYQQTGMLGVKSDIFSP